jgi:hypothetical protein
VGNLIESRRKIGVVNQLPGQGVTSTPSCYTAVSEQRSEDTIALDAVEPIGSTGVQR